MTAAFRGRGRSARPDSHAGYVHAVVAALRERSVVVTDLSVATAPLRHATMTVELTTSASGNAARLWWSERHGWCYHTHRPGPRHRPAAVSFGISLIPPPATVADWLQLSLLHPEAAPGRRGGDPAAEHPADPVEADAVDALLCAYDVADQRYPRSPPGRTGSG